MFLGKNIRLALWLGGDKMTCDNFVGVGVKAKPLTLERLFEMYTFLDGSPCGVSNGEKESDNED